jgi:hypothetical protein
MFYFRPMKKISITLLVFISLIRFASAHNKCIVLSYPFQKNANDATSAGVNGTVYNANLTQDRNGADSSAYFFNGSNAYIDLGNHYLLKRYLTDFTISAWIYLKQYSAGERSVILSNRDTSHIGSGISIGGALQNTGKLQLEIQGRANNSLAISNTVLELNQWYFITVTYTFIGNDMNVAKIYINGRLESTTVVEDVLEPVVTPTYIGFEPSQKTDVLSHFNGNIDEVFMYHCVLSDLQVLENFYPCKFLASYPFITDADDVSPNEIAGTAYEVTLTDSRDGSPNNAYIFDGTSSYIDLGNNPLLKRYATDFSISAWIYLNQYSVDERSVILSNRDTNNSGSGISIGGILQNRGRVQLEIQSGADMSMALSNTVLELKQWYMITATYSYQGGNINTAKIYVNGMLESSTLVKDIQDPLVTPTFIGFEPISIKNTLNHFDGIIDEVNLYGCVLPDQQVLDFYVPVFPTATVAPAASDYLVIYPNPGNGTCTIRSSVEGEYFLMNGLGQTIQKFNLGTSTDFTMYLENLDNGIYFIASETDHRMIRQKVLVAK